MAMTEGPNQPYIEYLADDGSQHRGNVATAPHAEFTVAIGGIITVAKTDDPEWVDRCGEVEARSPFLQYRADDDRVWRVRIAATYNPDSKTFNLWFVHCKPDGGEEHSAQIMYFKDWTNSVWTARLPESIADDGTIPRVTLQRGQQP